MELFIARQAVRAFFDAHKPLGDEIWEACLPDWQPFSAKRRTILTAAGERERYIYFVLDGVQRIYYVTPDGAKEATIIFTYAPGPSGVLDAIYHQGPSDFYFETITASTFLRCPAETFIRHCDTYPTMNELARILAAQALRGVMFRQAELQTSGAEAKFRALLQRSPHVLNLIPHKHLASYLGIDPTTFSKLLGKVRL